MSEKIPRGVIMALDLDDTSVLRTFSDQGIVFTQKGQQWYVEARSAKAAAAFIGELEYRASDAWNTSFGVRVGMARVAKRLRHSWADLP